VDTAAPVPCSGHSSTVLQTQGECVRETLQNLHRRGLSEAAIARIRDQAETVMADVLDTYTRHVAEGEVGGTGSARASDAPASAGACPTGLLYGRIQSGKTAAMIATSALSIDNGFRVVIVMTSNYIELVNQTLARFRDLEGPRRGTD
jgi:hypothetical protein